MWKLIDQPRNKHYADAADDSYERVMQRCFYVQDDHGRFIADLIVENSERGKNIAALMVGASNCTIALRDDFISEEHF